MSQEILWYFIISVSVHMCVYDVGCFVDVLASRSGYSGRKPSVPMIAILLSSSVGLSIEWLPGAPQVPGLRPDVFSCELKIHLRLWCIHCVRTILSPGCAIPSLIFHYQCVCSCVCVYDVGCFVDVLASRSGYSGRKPSVPMIAILLSSLVGLSIVTDFCVTGPGFAPRRVQLWIKKKKKR